MFDLKKKGRQLIKKECFLKIKGKKKKEALKRRNSLRTKMCIQVIGFQPRKDYLCV